MSYQQPENKNTIWPGLFSMIMGALIILFAMGIFHADDSSFNAPRWVVAIAGGIFFTAGILVSLSDPRLTYLKDHWLTKATTNILPGVILLCFAVVFNWVAFGPGDREFSGGITLFSISFFNEFSADLGGRIAFGCGAVFIDLIFVYWLISVVFAKIRSAASREV